MKYKKDQIVNCAGKLFKVVGSGRHQMLGRTYTLEAVRPDNNGNFEVWTAVPEGMITV